MFLPAFPQFNELSHNDVSHDDLNHNANNQQAFNERSTGYYLIALGSTNVCFLLIVIALAIYIWRQRVNIVRFRAYFRIHQREQDPQGQQPLLHSQEFNDMSVENQKILHHGLNVRTTVDLVFPHALPQFRNITALRAFHKTQRENLKSYQVGQEALYVEQQN